MNTEITIGERIKILRKEMGLSQAYIANRLGISKTTISNYETNYSVPSRQNLKNLADLFNVNIDYILGETEFKDRFVNFVKGVKIPIYSIENADAILNKSVDGITGYMDLPGCGQENIYDEMFAMKLCDNAMDAAGISKESYVIVGRSNQVPAGKIGVAVCENKVYVRRVHILDNALTLVPDSYDRKHMPMQFEREKSFVVGRVIKAIVDVF